MYSEALLKWLSQFWMNNIVYRTGLNISLFYVWEGGCQAENSVNKTAGGLINVFHTF